MPTCAINIAKPTSSMLVNVLIVFAWNLNIGVLLEFKHRGRDATEIVDASVAFEQCVCRGICRAQACKFLYFLLWGLSPSLKIWMILQILELSAPTGRSPQET